jgi:hypothetical protein
MKNQFIVVTDCWAKDLMYIRHDYIRAIIGQPEAGEASCVRSLICLEDGTSVLALERPSTIFEALKKIEEAD